jgi:molybdopterin biosynthesis enzyme
VRARLAQAIRHAPDRTEFQRAVVTLREGVYWAETTGVQVSGRLKSLVGANALLRLPSGVADFVQGAEVEALLITQPESE